MNHPKFHLLQLVMAMLKRPMMYAQSHESLEDQICLLMSMILDEWNITSKIVENYLIKVSAPERCTIASYINSYAYDAALEYKMNEMAKVLNLCFAAHLEAMVFQEDAKYFQESIAKEKK